MRKGFRKSGIVFGVIVLLFVAIATAGLSGLTTQIDGASAQNSDTLIGDIFDGGDIGKFRTDSVIVTLTRKESTKFLSYSKKSFSEVDGVLVEDLTQSTLEFAKAKIEGKQVRDDILVDTEEFVRILRIELRDKTAKSVLSAIAALKKREDILSAEPNYIYSVCAVPNDTRYNEQWGLGGGYGGIEASTAWNYTTGSSAVSVGVIDTGIQANHPDLVDRISTAGLHRDCRTNPITVISKANLTDDNGHGTNVAGIIGAEGNNNKGIAGVAWDVRLISLKTLDSNGNGDTASLIRAINFASGQGIPILNFSGGGYDEDTGVKSALAGYAGLFVCAAGNDNNNNDNRRFYPSDYSRGQSFSNRVISVGAINSDGTKRSTSNYGAESVSILAPGTGILTTMKNGSYDLAYGTSMAAPFVTGTAVLMYALITERTQSMSCAQIATNIKTTILDYSSKSFVGDNYCVSDGRLWAGYSIWHLPFSKEIFSNFGYFGSTYYWQGKVDMNVEDTSGCYVNSSNILVFNRNNIGFSFTVGTVAKYNAIYRLHGTVSLQLYSETAGTTVFTHTSGVEVNILNSVSIGNPTVLANTMDLGNGTYTMTLTSYLTRSSWSDSYTQTFRFIIDKPASSCVAEGTQITLADGSTKAVEDLTGEEMLLVWNLFTGDFDFAPILFIDSDPTQIYEIIQLHFSDGSSVKVISEHAFWDFDLNEYVFLRNDAGQYIGHRFNKQTADGFGDLAWTSVQLVAVDVYYEQTTAYSPVTFGHLCYYVNGMLSMPGATEGLINIFAVDPYTMTIDEDAYNADIAIYGLLDYSEVSDLMPEFVFEAFGGQYLLVSIGKGLTTWDDIFALLDRYSVFWS